MQIKITISYHLTLVRMVTFFFNLQIKSAGEDVEKREPSFTVRGNANWWKWKTVWRFLKN